VHLFKKAFKKQMAMIKKARRNGNNE